MATPETSTPTTLTPADAAKYIGMSLSWLAQARMRGEGPPYLKIGRSVRYRLADLDSWLVDRLCHPENGG